jgi:hypothetical protein
VLPLQLARIVAVAHSNARNCLWYSGLIEMLRWPSDVVSVCEDYKRIAGSRPYKYCWATAPNPYFFLVLLTGLCCSGVWVLAFACGYGLGEMGGWWAWASFLGAFWRISWAWA